MTSATSSGRPGDPLGVCAPEISSSGIDEPVCIHRVTMMPCRATLSTIPPLPRPTIPGTTQRVTLNVIVRLSAMSRFHSSGRAPAA